MVVVTGATGHIGANLCRALLERGRRVRVFLRGEPIGLEGLDVEIAHGDVLDPASLRAALGGAEVVFHLAAHISIIRSEDPVVRRVNIEGPRNVAEACLAAGVRRLVHCSSIHALQQAPLGQPLDETRAPSLEPGAITYDRSKAEGERAVQAVIARGLDAVIVNPTGVMGPFDYRPSRMGRVLLDLYHRRLPALVQGGFNWVDVRDVVGGLLGAEERGRRGERYLLGGHYRSIAEIGAAAHSVTGVRPPRLVAPMALCRLAAPPVSFVSERLGREPLFTSDSLAALRANRDIRSDKATRELGFRARPFEETIRDSYDWFRGAGMLRGR